MHIKKSLINLKNRLSKTKYVKLILKFYKVDTVVICFHRVLDDNNFINQKRPDNNLVVSSTFLFLPFCGEDVGDMGGETALGASPVIIEYQHFVILSPNFLTEDHSLEVNLRETTKGISGLTLICRY